MTVRNYTVNEVAAMRGVTPRTVYKWITDGKLKASKVTICGRKSVWQIATRDLTDMLKSAGV